MNQNIILIDVLLDFFGVIVPRHVCKFTKSKLAVFKASILFAKSFFDASGLTWRH